MKDKIISLLFEYAQDLTRELKALPIGEVKIMEDEIHVFNVETNDVDVLQVVFNYFRSLDIDIMEYTLHSKFFSGEIGYNHLTIELINICI